MANNTISKAKETKVVQISDCHLFADRQGHHFHANVYDNLSKVVEHITHYVAPDMIVFTGDLSQDHSQASYQNFVQVFNNHRVSIPVYFLAGNHDEPELLDTCLATKPFKKQDIIELPRWQIVLIDSKGDTPSGWVKHEQLKQLQAQINPEKAQLVMMHHHPVDVGYSIDKHGLLNKAILHDFVKANDSIVALACGHVHQALTVPMLLNNKNINLYTCPATSVQFDPHSHIGNVTNQGAGYRIFTLTYDQQLTTEVVFI